MPRRARILILDDDPWAAQMLAARVCAARPDAEVQARTRPDVTGDFDVCFIDNDFDGRPMAAALARQVRAARPDALLIAFSGTLSADLLRELINTGCDGVADKTRPEELDAVLRIVDGHVRRLRRPERSSGGLGSAIRGVAELLREWNTRLDRSEARAG